MPATASPIRPTPKHAVAGLTLLSLAATSLPIWAGAQALAAAPSPRPILECPDPEALAASPKLAGQVWSERLSHESLCLYFAAGSLAATDAAKATDLYALARIRSQYDFARCEAWPHGSTSSAMAALRMTAEGALVQAGVKTMLPQLIAAARADETFDYTLEDLEQRCDGGALKPVNAWKAEQRRIQASAEAASKPQVQ
jgi:hypothetical protein